MATVLLELESICAGGDHAIVSAKVGNQPKKDYPVSVDQVFAPWTAEDERCAAFYLVKLYAIGKTKVQVRNGLDAVVTVTI